jgi:F-type H+-transporting ATPase subunit delta
MPAAVASRYARALVDVVLAPASRVEPSRILSDLRSFQELLAASPELTSALESPAVKRPRKRGVIDRLAKQLDFAPVARNFLLVLVDHRRLPELGGVLAAFEKIVDERLGRLQVDVASASALQPLQQQALAQRIQTITGKNVRLNVTVDGDLMGGIVLRLGSTVYDGSVRGQLDSLARQLAAE